MSRARYNCWEYFSCGRESEGRNGATADICPAVNDAESDGTNQGRNGGRICWAVAGTLCSGAVQGNWAEKLQDCLKCEFYKTVEREQERTFVLFIP